MSVRIGSVSSRVWPYCKHSTVKSEVLLQMNALMGYKPRPNWVKKGFGGLSCFHRQGQSSKLHVSKKARISIPSQRLLILKKGNTPWYGSCCSVTKAAHSYVSCPAGNCSEKHTRQTIAVFHIGYINLLHQFLEISILF
jgi:hypothetical protein